MSIVSYLMCIQVHDFVFSTIRRYLKFGGTTCIHLPRMPVKDHPRNSKCILLSLLECGVVKSPSSCVETFVSLHGVGLRPWLWKSLTFWLKKTIWHCARAQDKKMAIGSENAITFIAQMVFPVKVFFLVWQHRFQPKRSKSRIQRTPGTGIHWASYATSRTTVLRLNGGTRNLFQLQLRSFYNIQLVQFDRKDIKKYLNTSWEQCNRHLIWLACKSWSGQPWKVLAGKSLEIYHSK